MDRELTALEIQEVTEKATVSWLRFKRELLSKFPNFGDSGEEDTLMKFFITGYLTALEEN